MFIRDWFRSLSRRPVRRASRRPSFRPVIEGLEDRSVPSGLGFSTHLTQTAYAVAVNAAGDSYVATSNSASLNGPTNVYEFDPSGNLLQSSPTLPGAGGGMALDSAGNVYLTTSGNTITELDPTLQTVLFSDTLPGANTNSVYGGGLPGTSNGAIAVAGGKIYVAGGAGPGLPTTAGAFQAAFKGGTTTTTNAYLAVIDPASSAPYHLTYCTYLGGSAPHTDAASGVAVDSSGNAYLTGTVSSTNFPTTAGAFQRKFGGGNRDAFAAKINPAASGTASLVYSTYLGGSGDDGYNSVGSTSVECTENSPSIAVDGSGNAYVTGSTSSSNFPTTRGAFQTKFGGEPRGSNILWSGDAFVTKLNPSGSGLVYSTYLGGSGWDGASGIAVNAAGDVYVTGWTWSTNFPTVNPIQSQNAGFADAYVAELNASGSGLLFSTYLGGTSDDWGMALAVDASGDIYVAGNTMSSDFPITAGAYETSGEGFGLKITP